MKPKKSCLTEYRTNQQSSPQPHPLLYAMHGTLTDCTTRAGHTPGHAIGQPLGERKWSEQLCRHIHLSQSPPPT